MTFDEWKEQHKDELEFFGNDSMLYRRLIGWCENAYFTGCLEMQDREEERHEGKSVDSGINVFDELNAALFPGRA